MNSPSLHFEPDASESVQPIVHEFAETPDLLESFNAFLRLKHCLLLDSSRLSDSPGGTSLGRYSFLMADPIEWIEGSVEVLENVRRILGRFTSENLPDLPPFQGGIAGLLGYDLNRGLEDIGSPQHQEIGVPPIALGLYDVVIAWDHKLDRAFAFSNGMGAPDQDSRFAKAKERLDYFLSALDEPTAIDSIYAQQSEVTKTLEKMGPAFPTKGPEGLLSNFTRSEYLTAVERAIEYIHAGDIFQVNFAQRLLYPQNCHASELYVRLRRCNPAPFGGYFDLGKTQIASTSPERLISVSDRVVETRPIKGTRKRTRYPEVDLDLEIELSKSEKDRAENIMIVDLMRNDLSRVCKDDSVDVTQLCAVEKYESVLHLVSAVTGELKEDCDLVDLLKAVFPGGSITGAPKIRAMEIISELEGVERGAYCGSLGYIGLDGTLDFNILIRTITAQNGWWQIPVGGGIVSQSDPENEYEETWTKAAGMLRALTH